ncbi:hypothetical protein SMICM304S_01916 [Streptomyces microflavus]
MPLAFSVVRRSVDRVASAPLPVADPLADSVVPLASSRCTTSISSSRACSYPSVPVAAAAAVPSSVM